MITFKKRLKAIALLLTVLMQLQSCMVYQKTSTTLERASQNRIRTKVVTAENQTYKFTYITYDNGVFWGVKERNGEPVKTSLYDAKVTGVYELNNAASTWTTLATFIATPIVLVGIAGVIYALE